MNKLLYKYLLIAIKYFPILISIAQVIYVMFTYFGLYLLFFYPLFSTSLIFIVFMYFTSFALKFCWKHRVFIHYLLLVNILNVINFSFGINFPIFILILFPICFILYVKNNEFERLFSKVFKRNCR